MIENNNGSISSQDILKVRVIKKIQMSLIKKLIFLDRNLINLGKKKKPLKIMKLI